MDSLINLPKSDEEGNLKDFDKSSAKKSLLKFLLSVFAGAMITFSFAGSINLNQEGEFELGNRFYDVSSCAKNVQVVPKLQLVSGETRTLSQFTVTGVDPSICQGRRIDIKTQYVSNNEYIPLIASDPSGPVDNPAIQIFVSGGEFLATETSTITLSPFSETETVRRTGATPGVASVWISERGSGNSAVKVLSAGQGKTLKSTDADQVGPAISFQVRLSAIELRGGNIRTPSELYCPTSPYP